MLGVENLESVDYHAGGEFEIELDDIVDYPVNVLWTPAYGGNCVILKFYNYDKLSHYLKMRSYLMMKAEKHLNKMGMIKIWD